jgi:D-glycero-D-manno-heptose 1,7-bisphosphate phosphatase
MKLVILDRDGVINEDSDNYIKSPAEWVPIPGSLEAIARLNHYGYKIAVATNQSGIARGLYTIDDLNAIHQKMRTLLDRVGGHFEGIFFCPHGPDEGCDCRKPRTGLLHQIARRLGTSLTDIPVIGDSKRDLDSATQVGAIPVLVRTGKGERMLKKHPELLKTTAVYPDLAAAADAIITLASES